MVTLMARFLNLAWLLVWKVLWYREFCCILINRLPVGLCGQCGGWSNCYVETHGDHDGEVFDVKGYYVDGGIHAGFTPGPETWPKVWGLSCPEATHVCDLTHDQNDAIFDDLICLMLWWATQVEHVTDVTEACIMIRRLHWYNTHAFAKKWKRKLVWSDKVTLGDIMPPNKQWIKTANASASAPQPLGDGWAGACAGA